MHCMTDRKKTYAELKAMGDRLREARVDRYPDDDAREVCARHRFVYSTYMGHEQGNRDFSRDVDRYARAYGVEVEWLLTARGPKKRKGSNPVLDLFQSLPPEKQAQWLEYGAFLRNRKD